MMRRIFPLVALAAISAPLAHAAEGPPWTDPATNTALAALVVFLGVVWYFGGFRIVGNMLDKRSEEIDARLKEARALREEAAAALASAERRQKEASKDAEAIVARAKQDAEAMITEARDELSRRVARREALAEARITRAGEEAAAEVRRSAADAATEAARRILSESTPADEFETALSSIEQVLN